MHVNARERQAGSMSRIVNKCRDPVGAFSTKLIELSKTRARHFAICDLQGLVRSGVMCELLGLSSNIPATVNVSLPKLAEHGRVSGTYNDGWGVGYYEGAEVRLMEDSAAVGDSEWIEFIATHNLRSQLVIAHTRRATRGARAYPNAQPFVRELAGRAHFLPTMATCRAYSSRTRSGPDASAPSARPTPSTPFALCSTGWRRSGRRQRRRRRCASDS